MHGTGGLSRRLAGAALTLLVTACGSATAQISPDTVAPNPPVTPNACSLLPGAAVATALGPPAAGETASASGAAQPPAGTAALPVPPARYAVASVGTHTPAGQCTYATSAGPAVVVSVLPHATLGSVADLTSGATPLGPALVQVTGSAGAITVQKGDAVVEIALDMGGLTQDALTRRLAALAEAVTNQALPVPGLPAPAATSTPSPTATPTPAVAGQQVTGLTAAQTVQETADLKFNPGSITVSSGGVVLWTNSGSAPHNVTFDANPEITSGTMNPADRYEVRFLKPGQYSYHCTFHPGMDGSVTVS